PLSLHDALPICPVASFTTISFDATEKSKSPIKMTWSDGGIRPAHPDIIPADHDIGGQNSNNGVLMIGDKGIISTNINDSSPLMPKLYLNDGTTEFGDRKSTRLNSSHV